VSDPRDEPGAVPPVEKVGSLMSRLLSVIAAERGEERRATRGVCVRLGS